MFGAFECTGAERDQIYGCDDSQSTVVHKSFPTKFPEIYKFLQKFEVTLEELEAMIIANQPKNYQVGRLDKTAREWLVANPERVKEWFDNTPAKHTHAR